MVEKFTPEEIAESLEVCQNTGIGCTGCALDEHPDYSDVEIFCRCDLEKKAAEAIKELLEENKRLREENRWIPVEEQLPEEFVSVLVCIPSENPLPTVKEAYLANGAWATKMAIFFMEEVTHWKPMPKGAET